jgi:large-conductance mechanosensitive channel
MLQGFKQFILRGNVLDLAVAVVMGVAFAQSLRHWSKI